MGEGVISVDISHCAVAWRHGDNSSTAEFHFCFV